MTIALKQKRHAVSLASLDEGKFNDLIEPVEKRLKEQGEIGEGKGKTR